MSQLWEGARLMVMLAKKLLISSASLSKGTFLFSLTGHVDFDTKLIVITSVFCILHLCH